MGPVISLSYGARNGDRHLAIGQIGSGTDRGSEGRESPLSGLPVGRNERTTR